MKMLPKTKVSTTCKSSRERCYASIPLEQINRQLENGNSPLRVVEEYPLDAEVLCYCSDCKQVYRRSKRSVIRGSGCSVCCNRIIIPGYNDIATTAPDVIKYFANPNESFLYPKTTRKKILTKCPECGNERQMSINHLVSRGFSCPCSNYMFSFLIPGLNDVATKAPWMVQFFADKNDASKYSISSPQKVLFQCPMCGDTSLRSVAAVHVSGYSCKKCSDGISYPNKFSRYLLDQLPVVNVEYEYTRAWTQRKMYDNYFEYNGEKYFLEMDGGFHYMDNTYSGESLQVAQKVDAFKDRLAAEHDIKIIRIDSRNANMEVLQKAFIESELGVLFDLSKIDWLTCELNARKNILMEACYEYIKNTLTIKEIAKKYHVSTCTMRRYLDIGKQIGIIDPNDDSKSRTFKIQEKRRGNVGNIYDLKGIFISDFFSYADAARKLRALCPNTVFNESRICAATKNNKQYKGFIFTVTN